MVYMYYTHIYVPHGCVTWPVVQPDAGYVTGHPVVQPDIPMCYLNLYQSCCLTGQLYRVADYATNGILVAIVARYSGGDINNKVHKLLEDRLVLKD